MKPVIGINVDIEEAPRRATVQGGYFDAILKSDGIPVLIPPMPDADMKELLTRIDGVLFIGGADYFPSLYGEKANPAVHLLQEERNNFDIKLLKQVVGDTNLPVLGICGGCQILNIGLGGSLIQDIPGAKPNSSVVHSSESGWKKGWTKHAVQILPDTKLSRIYGAQSISVPTSHHQAVKDTGRGLVVAARAEDNIIEAVELENRPFVIGVQWHPERDFDGNKSLFAEFVKHAARHNVGSR